MKLRLILTFVMVLALVASVVGCATSTLTIRPGEARADSPDILERLEADPGLQQVLEPELRELAIQAKESLREGGDE